MKKRVHSIYNQPTINKAGCNRDIVMITTIPEKENISKVTNTHFSKRTKTQMGNFSADLCSLKNAFLP